MPPRQTAQELVCRLAEPTVELRFLLDRGYRRQHALGFVCDHHQLILEDRNALERFVFPAEEARARRARLVDVSALRGAEVVVDGYNVVIGVECHLGGIPVFRCDDGLTRDAAGVRGRHRPTDVTTLAVAQVVRLFDEAAVARVWIVLDAQVSHSGQLAEICREVLEGRGVQGGAETERHADRALRRRASGSVVCSSDRAVVDGSPRVFDVVGALAEADGELAEPAKSPTAWRPVP